MKVSYSCMQNMSKIYKGHKSKIISTLYNQLTLCNCQVKRKCPMNSRRKVSHAKLWMQLMAVVISNLTIYLSKSIDLPIYLSIDRSMDLSIYLSIYLSVYLSKSIYIKNCKQLSSENQSTIKIIYMQTLLKEAFLITRPSE